MYSSRSQQCFCVDGLVSSSDFHLSNPFSKPLGTVPSAQTIISITVTLIFHSFSLAISLFFLFLLFSLFGPLERQNPLDGKFSFFFSFFFLPVLLINTRTNLLAGIRWSFCIPKSLRILCVSDGFWFMHLVVWLDLQNCQWINFPAESCLLLSSLWFYSFESFHISIRWCFFSQEFERQQISSSLKNLFSILTDLNIRCFLLVLWFLSLLVPLPILRELFLAHQSQLVSWSLLVP